MARKVRFHIVTYDVSGYHSGPVDIELADDEVARVVHTSVATKGDEYDRNTKLIVLVVTGPPETVDEMAKAMERTLRSAP